MSATWDKFHGAALLLAGAGPVKQRLADAFRTHLVDLDAKDLPRELRAEFLSLSASLTSGRAVGGSSVFDTTVRKLSEVQAAAFAGRFIVMYGQLAQSRAQAQRAPALRAINSSQASFGAIELEFDSVDARRFLVTRLALDRVHELALIPGHHLVRYLLQGRRDRILRTKGFEDYDGLVESLGAVQLEIDPVDVPAVKRRRKYYHLCIVDLLAQVLPQGLAISLGAIFRRAGVTVVEVARALQILEYPVVILVWPPDMADEEPDRVCLRDVAHLASSNSLRPEWQ